MTLVNGGDVVTLAGQPVTSGYTVLDTFAYDEGPIHGLGGWVDAYSLYPTMFDEAVCSGGKLSCQSVHLITGSEESLPTWRTGHWLIAQDVGLSDNFEVTIDWTIPTTWAGLQQVSPACFIDLESTDELEMGVCPVWDISLPPGGATYFQNVFRAPVADTPNPDYYTSLGAAENGGPAAADGDTTRQVIKVRCVNGTLTYWWDGVQRGNPTSSISVPAWAEGRTWMGVNVHGLDWVGTYPDSSPVTEPGPGEASYFRVRAL